eukprot:COSAG03_NODE_28_length_18724_cov_10.718128_12_plen_67_part_00
MAGPESSSASTSTQPVGKAAAALLRASVRERAPLSLLQSAADHEVAALTMLPARHTTSWLRASELR